MNILPSRFWFRWQIAARNGFTNTIIKENYRLATRYVHLTNLFSCSNVFIGQNDNAKLPNCRIRATDRKSAELVPIFIFVSAMHRLRDSRERTLESKTTKNLEREKDTENLNSKLDQRRE